MDAIKLESGFFLGYSPQKKNSYKNVNKHLKFVLTKLCNELQRATTSYNELQRATTSYNELQRATTSYNELQ